MKAAKTRAFPQVNPSAHQVARSVSLGNQTYGIRATTEAKEEQLISRCPIAR